MQAQLSGIMQNLLEKFKHVQQRPVILFSGAAALLAVVALVALLGSGVIGGSPQDQPPAQAIKPSKDSMAAAPASDPASDSISEPTSDPAISAGYSAFIPVVSAPLVQDPHSATLTRIQGLVQIEQSNGIWVAAESAHTLAAGQRVRTAALSSAVLAFYDGSQAFLGSDTQVTIDELDAPASGAARVVKITQLSGETRHQVATAQVAGSRYEVHTPSATGAAKGTSFGVRVTPEQRTRFSVDEGAVAVTGRNATVTVVAGQATTVAEGETPEEPVFRITGEGEVSQTGATWIIAGQPFSTHADTVIVGNPQVGDWVYVEGHLTADDERIADLIELRERSPANRFTITGPAEAIAEGAWTIAGQTVAVSETTTIDDDIQEGDLVRAEGVILEGGTLLAESIRAVKERPGLPFEFTGVVQEMGDASWTVSGVVLTLDAETEVEAGLAAGDIVKVEGWILEDGSWLATSIRRVLDEERAFEFTGVVESIDPWVVAGIGFETREWTEVEAGIEEGDLVKVEGQILPDGTWVASEIKRLDEEEEEPTLEIVFVGTVNSVDPWVVSDIPLTVDADTAVDEGILAGDLVRVTARVLPDGTWLALSIQRLDVEEPGQGCVQITAVVVGLSGDQVDLSNWPSVDLSDVTVIGELQVGSVVLMQVCVDDEGNVTIVSITVIYQPEPDDTPTPVPPPQDDDDDDDDGDDDDDDDGDQGEQVTICHRPPGNPDAAHTITIGRAALQAHLDHGDTMGPCSGGGNGGDDGRDNGRGKDRGRDD